MRPEEARRDHYRRLARREGYPSRAAYKLLQIDRSYRILREGFKVVDFGCAPGGWLKVASRAVGRRGLVVGVDLRKPGYHAGNVRTILADVEDPATVEKVVRALGGKADVVLSDLSPRVTGVWEVDHFRQLDLTGKVFDMMPRVLRRGGSVVVKAFEGGELPEFLRKVRRLFERLHVVRPPATRKASSEVFLVGLGYKGG